MNPLDTLRHQGLRKRLVEGLRIKGIKDEQVLNAISKVPRHLFMDSGFIQFAYRDQAFPIGAGQTISQPYTVAFQTWLLQLNTNDKVLEVGTGSGYQAAVLLEMGVNVFTIERQRELLPESSTGCCPVSGISRNSFTATVIRACRLTGRLKRLLLRAGAPYIPEDLMHQLTIGGRNGDSVGTYRSANNDCCCAYWRK